MPADKVMSPAEAAALVGDGDHVAVQGMGTQGIPMTMVRELIRAGRRDLTITAVVGGIGIDWLAFKGAMSRFCGPIVSMERFGMCRGFRRAVEARRIEFDEYSESGLLTRLAAGARNLPFGITRSMIGTDLPALHPDTITEIADPFTGERVLACRSLRPEVCLLHAHRADRRGNIQYDGGAIWPDVQIYPKASGRTIVTVEAIVSEEVVRERPDQTVIPHFAVDAVVLAPHGCHPTSFFPDYVYDEQFHSSWAELSRDPERAVAEIDRLCGASSQDEYLELIGEAAVSETRNWRERA
ncbi:MAG TPA: CoA-transferase [Solirubrobacteraceae bacterium]|nr:CoA-transferase [Solirubrobacteraceae bacterium]